MQKKGHSVIIVEDNDQHDDECPNEYGNGQSKMSRSHYADKVKDLMIRTRGCELPGTYNPLVVGELFIEQCKPWESLVRRFTSNVLDAALFAINSALHHATDENTAVSLLHEIINPKLYDLRQALEKKIAEVLEPHKSRHPITYNHYLTENVQKAQAQRRRRQLKGVLQRIFGQKLLQGEYRYELDVNELLSQLVETTEADMDRYASYAAIDVMEAYYKLRACNMD
ncbi:Dynamin central region [Aspergillus sp. HF37]|nr:Dynamin central region [Aspergillus sp. HF37]